MDVQSSQHTTVCYGQLLVSDDCFNMLALSVVGFFFSQNRKIEPKIKSTDPSESIITDN